MAKQNSIAAPTATIAPTVPTPADIERAAVRSQVCRDAIDRLSAMEARSMTPADFDALVQAQGELAEMAALLNRAGVTAPTVDVAELLMVTAALLLEQPTRILAHDRLVATVLAAAGPQVSTVALRPVWEALPLNPEGDEHREYAARLILTAKFLRAVAA